MKSQGIIECDISDVRINDKFIMEYHPSSADPHDYAIVKLNCPDKKPTNPFKIRHFSNYWLTQLKLAGYRGTRTLMVEDHVRIKNSAKKFDKTPKTMISTGESGGGDSGGPYYDTWYHDIRAIHNGVSAKNENGFQKFAIKIYKPVHKIINEMAKGNDGISMVTKRCSDDKYGQKTCWSACYTQDTKPETTCFSSAQQTRLYDENERKMPCDERPCGDNLYHEKTRKECKFNYLCGAIKQCEDEQDPKKKCLGKCVDRNSVGQCPSNRQIISPGKHIECEYKWFFVPHIGYRHFCGPKISTAHSNSFNNLMDEYYYDLDDDDTY